MFLSRLASRVDRHRRGTPVDDVVAALDDTVATVRRVADREGTRCLLTAIVTDGELLVAHHGGKELCFSTWKRKCPERESCAFLSPACESPVKPGDVVNHLVVSSEPLQGENHWESLAEGQMVAVDPFLRFRRYS